MIRNNQKIPDGWCVKKLGGCGFFSKGSGITKNDLCKDGLPCLRYAEIYTKYDFQIKSVLSFIPESISKSAKKIESNTLIFAGSGETKEDIGKCVSYDGLNPIFVGGDTVIFNPRQGFKSIYASYYLNTKGRRQLNRLGQGDSIVHIHAKELEKVMIPVPPLAEQEKIADILGCWDTAIEKLTALIDAKKQRKKALMQNLLTAKIRLSGFADEWKKVEISELLNYEQPTSYLVKKVEAFEKNKIPVLTANKSFIIGSTSDTCGVYDKSICIIFDDFTTDMKFVDFSFKVKSSAIKILTAKFNVNIKFVFEQMSLIKFSLGGHKRYYLSEYQYIPIPIPSLPEQQAIADILSKADEEIDLLTKKLFLIQEQKKGLMQKLLTGQIRVKVV